MMNQKVMSHPETFGSQPTDTSRVNLKLAPLVLYQGSLTSLPPHPRSKYSIGKVRNIVTQISNEPAITTSWGSLLRGLGSFDEDAQRTWSNKLLSFAPGQTSIGITQYQEHWALCVFLLYDWGGKVFPISQYVRQIKPKGTQTMF